MGKWKINGWRRAEEGWWLLDLEDLGSKNARFLQDQNLGGWKTARISRHEPPLIAKQTISHGLGKTSKFHFLNFSTRCQKSIWVFIGQFGENAVFCEFYQIGRREDRTRQSDERRGELWEYGFQKVWKRLHLPRPDQPWKPTSRLRQRDLASWPNLHRPMEKWPEARTWRNQQRGLQIHRPIRRRPTSRAWRVDVSWWLLV